MDASGNAVEYMKEDGILAQDIEAIPELKHAVAGGNADEPLSLCYQSIYIYAVRAMQELDVELQAEKAKTASLETQVASLLERVTALET